LHAERTARFINKKWDEDPSNYHIQTMLTDSMTRRLNEIKKYGVK